MKKDLLKSLFALMCACMMATGFVACGSDDDKGKDGSDSTPNYIGVWIEKDTQSEMYVLTLASTSWERVEYGSDDKGPRKKVYSGSLSVSGNTLSISGNAPFNKATFSISGNQMTIVPEGNPDQKMIVTRATDAQSEKIVAWEFIISNYNKK